MKTSQREKVLKALEKGRSLTQLDAIREWGCFRLGARIYDLKQLGYTIIADTVTSSNGKSFASYRLAE